MAYPIPLLQAMSMDTIPSTDMEVHHTTEDGDLYCVYLPPNPPPALRSQARRAILKARIRSHPTSAVPSTTFRTKRSDCEILCIRYPRPDSPRRSIAAALPRIPWHPPAQFDDQDIAEAIGRIAGDDDR